MNVITYTYPFKRKKNFHPRNYSNRPYLISLLFRMPCCEWRVRHVPATSSTQQDNTATKLLTVIWYRNATPGD
jgi:hypothetical protein